MLFILHHLLVQDKVKGGVFVQQTVIFLGFFAHDFSILINFLSLQGEENKFAFDSMLATQ
ncbi:MAG TPA: hypothetical protein DDY20_03330 [Desulfobulbaceae bacterium]|nr:hypothetical protein [Desulfobulbaceae bacterium]